MRKRSPHYVFSQTESNFAKLVIVAGCLAWVGSYREATKRVRPVGSGPRELSPRGQQDRPGINRAAAPRGADRY